jgi:hypothetical protein
VVRFILNVAMCELKVPHAKKIIMQFGFVNAIDNYKVFLLTSNIVFYGVLFVPFSSKF